MTFVWLVLVCVSAALFLYGALGVRTSVLAWADSVERRLQRLEDK